MTTAPDAARLCHSSVVRLPSATDAAPPRSSAVSLLSMNSTGVLFQQDRITTVSSSWTGPRQATAAAADVVWVEDVPSASDTPEADAWRSRELARPVDPAVGPASRRVLLRHTDGVADLVTVEHRAARRHLGVALLAGLRAIDSTSGPEWGLGDPADHGLGWIGFELGELADDTVFAALALVLARYGATTEVVIGTADPRYVLTVDVDPELPVTEYLKAPREWCAVAERVPVVGLSVGSGRAFLAPPHPLSLQVDTHDRNSGHALPIPRTRADEQRTRAGGTRGGCWFRRSRVDERVVERFVRHLVTAHQGLLTAAAAAGERDVLVGDVEIMDAGEWRELAELGGVGRRPAGTTARSCVHRMVAEQAALTPDAVAVCCEDGRVTYAELDERADRVAHGLRAAGVARGALVGVCLERSVDLVVALLAVLKAGAAYVPLDPHHPAERRAFTIADAGLTLVIAEAEPEAEPDRAEAEPDGAEAGVVPTRNLRSLAGQDLAAQPLPDEAEPDDAAYVIYTSGSTGVPKGVVVPHRAVAALLDATRDDLGLGDGDVWTQFHSAAFDFSVWEIWACLATGGRLVVVPYWRSRSPEEFAALLAAERVTALNQTPSAFWQLLDVDRRAPLPDSLRLVVFGGEPLDTAPLLEWFDRHPERICRLVNMYGITETTVHVTAQTVTRAEALRGSRSVGHALPGWHVYVLDPAGRMVPPGVAGEIHVGGAGVADRYLGRPELTTERFVPDPFAGGVMYRSGDRGRLLPDGRLEHLGRLDNQVKLRGHRIELDEIRLRLLAAPDVASAAVVVRQQDDDAATARLAGYVVFRDGRGDVAQVLRHAARFLPEYMVPATVTALPALPLTPNGKLDTARLPRPVERRAAAPKDGATVVERVRTAWEGVFGFSVGHDDDFFTLGGNSLLAVRLAAAIRDAGLPPMSIRDLYSHRTVSRLAARLEPA